MLADPQYHALGFPDGLAGKETAFNEGERRCEFDPWVRKIPWRRKWQSTLVFSFGKSHGWEESDELQSKGVAKSRTLLSTTFIIFRDGEVYSSEVLQKCFF